MVIINEIAWMGADVSPNDEWIELYNNTGQEINLEGWQIVSQDGKPTIELKGKIKPQGFFLLERTDESSVLEIEADLIYTGALSNKGEYLRLIDNQGDVIDELNGLDGWLAGDNKTKQTMEKTCHENCSRDKEWQTSQKPGGTPRAVNSPGIEMPDKSSTTKELTKNGSSSILQEEAETRPLQFAGVGSLSSSTKDPSLPFGFVFFSGLTISFVLAALILLVKKRLKPYDKTIGKKQIEIKW